MAFSSRKSVYPTSEVPHLWAHGRWPDSGEIRNPQGNLFAREGDATIYSYGSHFPISRRVVVNDPAHGERVVFLFTTQTYSSTTGGHISAAYYAARGNGRIFYVDPESFGEDLWRPLATRKGSTKPLARWFQERINRAVEAATRPRIRATTRERHWAEADRLRAEWLDVHQTFRLRISADAVKVPTSEELDAQRAAAMAAAKRAEAAEERARAKREAAAMAAAAEALRVAAPHWRATGETRAEDSRGQWYPVSEIPYPILRMDGAEVVSSWGARVPEAAARRLLRNLPQLLAEPFDAMAEVGGYYGVGANSAGLRIGCHRIPWAEVVAFCAYYNWPLPDGIPPADAEEVASLAEAAA